MQRLHHVPSPSTHAARTIHRSPCIQRSVHPAKAAVAKKFTSTCHAFTMLLKLCHHVIAVYQLTLITQVRTSSAIEITPSLEPWSTRRAKMRSQPSKFTKRTGGGSELAKMKSHQMLPTHTLTGVHSLSCIECDALGLGALYIVVHTLHPIERGQLLCYCFALDWLFPALGPRLL